MVGRMKLGDAPDTIVVAERIRAAWRDLRRAGSTGAVRTYLYEPDAPLDVAQADALDLIVTHAPIRMSEVAALLLYQSEDFRRLIQDLGGKFPSSLMEPVLPTPLSVPSR